MLRVLVTGAKGFVGQNLCTRLRLRAELQLLEHDLDSVDGALDSALAQAEVVVHLAGVNRPERSEGFAENHNATLALCTKLEELGRTPKLIYASTIQAALDNPYGASKRAAEEELRRYGERAGGEAVVYRFSNLFGKWCRPNYNSVTATFCHNIARDLPIQISDPDALLELSYIDDVCEALEAELTAESQPGFRFAPPLRTHRTSLGALAEQLRFFRAHRSHLLLPDYADPFVRALYATYLSYLEPGSFAYSLQSRVDDRGSLAEFIKSPQAGQLFVSRTKPGITRGNHYHHTKTEKFMVVEGEAVVRFRDVRGGEVMEYRVRGADYSVVDIPPGYTHSIENVGTGELVTLFWASEPFDPKRADTDFLPVLQPTEKQAQ
jgi:UDP-2-acetamido-2,6-beta-L-arabino-hexul-4-ose reductase